MFNILLLAKTNIVVEDLLSVIVLGSLILIVVIYIIRHKTVVIYWFQVCLSCLLYVFFNSDCILLDELIVPQMMFSHFLFVDRLSLLFCLMSVFIIGLCIYYTTRQLSLVQKTNLLLLLTIQALVLICFCSRSIVLFYLSFELLMFPMVWLILVYGSRGRRVFASYLFFGYTFLSSFLMIAGMFILYTSINSFQFDHFLYGNFETNNSLLIMAVTLFWLAFSIKIPTIPFHLWLPEAHVEAPTIGSVILAAILLKLGGFGFLRLVIPLSSVITSQLRVIPIVFCAISVIYGSFFAFRHFDLKKIIAYSSIVHMNLSSIPFFMESKVGLVGAVASMLCHSVIAGGLFFTAGFLYERMKTRNLILYGCLFSNINLFYFLVFILLLANMSAPFMFSFIAELMVISGIFISNMGVFFTILASLFLSSLFVFALLYRIIYSNNDNIMRIFKFYQKGYLSVSPLGYSTSIAFSVSETLILGSLCFIIILLLFYPDLFLVNIINFTWAL